VGTPSALSPGGDAERWLPARWLLLLAGVAALLFVLFRDWAYDDPFITFRYAANLQAGLGFVYNPGLRVLSTTTPLYTLLLALLGLLWPDLPRLSVLVGAVSLGLGGLALYLLGRCWRTPTAGALAALLYPLSPLMLGTLGAETGFYLMWVLGALALYARGRYRGAAVLAGLATLTRGDGILVGGVLALAFLGKHRRVPWRPLGLFLLTTLPWFLFAWGYFGSPFPATLAAKRFQAQMAISDSFLEGFVRMVVNYARQPLYLPYGLLLVLGLGYAMVRARPWLLLVAWGSAYFIGYTLLGVSRYFWYYAPFTPVFLALVGLGGQALEELGSRALPGLRRHPWWRWVLAGLLLVPQLTGIRYLYRHPDPRARIYRDVGRWLAEHTPPGARVGTLEVGIIGYYAQRPMVDFAGLIQPEVARQMGRESTYEDTALWAVRTYRPEFLVLDPNGFPRLMQEFVASRCTPLRRFARPEYSGELVVYRCDVSDESSLGPSSPSLVSLAPWKGRPCPGRGPGATGPSVGRSARERSVDSLGRALFNRFS